MGENRDIFVGLGWEKEIRSLGNPHIPFNSSPEFEFRPANQVSDDYELTPFLQSTQARRWKMHEEQKRSAKNDKRRADCQPKTLNLDCVLVWVRAKANMYLT